MELYCKLFPKTIKIVLHYKILEYKNMLIKYNIFQKYILTVQTYNAVIYLKL